MAPGIGELNQARLLFDETIAAAQTEEIYDTDWYLAARLGLATVIHAQGLVTSRPRQKPSHRLPSRYRTDGHTVTQKGVVTHERAILEELIEDMSRVAVDANDELATSRSVTYWMAKNNLANCLVELGEEDAAVALLEDVIAGTAATSKEDIAYDAWLLAETDARPIVDSFVLLAEKNLATVLAKQGHSERARPLLEGIVARLTQSVGANHTDTLAAKGNLANLYSGEAARRLLEEVVAGQSASLGEEHELTLSAKTSLAFLLAEQDENEGAKKLVKQVIQVRSAHPGYGPGHETTLASQLQLAALLEEDGELEDAVTAYELVVCGKTARFGAMDPDTLEAQHMLAMVLQNTGKLEAARAALESVVSGYAMLHGADAVETLMTKVSLAAVMGELSDMDSARLVFASAIAGLSAALGPKDPMTQAARQELARIEHEAAREDARKQAEQAAQQVEELLAMFGTEGAGSAPVAPADSAKSAKKRAKRLRQQQQRKQATGLRQAEPKPETAGIAAVAKEGPSGPTLAGMEPEAARAYEEQLPVHTVTYRIPVTSITVHSWLSGT